MSRSDFPLGIDRFKELYDLPPQLVVKATRYQELKRKPSLSSQEQTEVNQITTELDGYIISPEVWNKMGDSITSVETFFKDNVDGYIIQKQKEWATYVQDFTHKGVYSNATQYKFQNTVTYNGDIYLCTKDAKGILPTVNTHWQKASSKGDKGDVGLNTNFRGDHDKTKTYVLGDAVAFDGFIFYAKKNVSAGVQITDSDHWHLFDKYYASEQAPSAPSKGLTWVELI